MYAVVIRSLLKLVLVASLAVVAGCGQSSDVPQAVAMEDVREMMIHYLEPAADTVWDSAGWVVTEAGETNLAPTTEDEWLRVRHAATVVAEGGHLLLVPKLVPELASGKGDWAEYSRATVRIGRQLVDIAEARDADALFEVGGHLYNVCRACHQVYDRPE